MKKKLLSLLTLALFLCAPLANATKGIQISNTPDGITVVGGTKLYADENNMIKGLKFIIKLRNSGDPLKGTEDDIHVGD